MLLREEFIFWKWVWSGFWFDHHATITKRLKKLLDKICSTSKGNGSVLFDIRVYTINQTCL